MQDNSVSNSEDIAGFETIKVSDAKWGYEKLLCNPDISEKSFIELFLEERGNRYKIKEIKKLYEILMIRIKNECNSL